MTSENIMQKGFSLLNIHNRAIEVIEVIKEAEKKIAVMKESTYYSVFATETQRERKIKITEMAIERLT